MELLWPGAGPVHKVHAVYVSSTIAPDTWIDVTDTIEAKIAALSAHRSQLGDRDIAPLILGWAMDAARHAPARKAAGKRGTRRTRHAEAFRVMRLLREES
jgi:LmbE family N-acetylglucosaminyl deacetylase